MTCIPKHIFCNWYKPDFIPSNTPCTLQTSGERRSRLLAGGTLFRSIDFGFNANNIMVSCRWMVQDGTGGYRYYDPVIDTIADVERVELFITNGTINEYYYAPQNLVSSPIKSAIPALRDQINGTASPQTPSSLISMPEIDVESDWDINDPTNNGDDTYLNEFILTSLSGGSGPPLTNLNNLRTGPYLTLYMINSTENENGEIISTNKILYWNGACWKPYDPLNPDYCITNPDLPTVGSPVFCENGPESEC